MNNESLFTCFSLKKNGTIEFFKVRKNCVGTHVTHVHIQETCQVEKS